MVILFIISNAVNRNGNIKSDKKPILIKIAQTLFYVLQDRQY